MWSLAWVFEVVFPIVGVVRVACGFRTKRLLAKCLIVKGFGISGQRSEQFANVNSGGVNGRGNRRRGGTCNYGGRESCVRPADSIMGPGGTKQV